MKTSKTNDDNNLNLRKAVMVMLSVLFLFFFIMIFGKLAMFAFKASWSIFKVIMFVVFLPLIIAGLALGGLIYIAFPVLVVAGLISIFARAS